MNQQFKVTFAFAAAAALVGCGSQTRDPGPSPSAVAEAPETIAAQPSTASPDAAKPNAPARLEGITLRGTTKPTANFDRCMDSGEAAEGVTAAMVDCLGDEIELQDVRLNATYKAVMATLDDAGKRRLRESQRSWIESRDESCDRASDEENDGSLEFVTSNTCILNKTIERSSWLEKYS